MRMWVSGTILKAEALGVNPQELIYLASLMSVYVDNPIIAIDVDEVNEEELIPHQIRISRSRLPEVIQERWKDASDSELAKWLRGRVEDYVQAYKRPSAEHSSIRFKQRVAEAPNKTRVETARKKFDPSALKKGTSVKNESETPGAVSLSVPETIQAEVGRVEQSSGAPIQQQSESVQSQSTSARPPVNSQTLPGNGVKPATLEEGLAMAMEYRKQNGVGKSNDDQDNEMSADDARNGIFSMVNQFNN